MALDKVSAAMMNPQSVGESAPSNPTVGQRWYRASTAITYQYTNDGTSSFWLDVSSGGIGTSADRGVDYVGDTDPKPNHNGGSATLSVGQVYYNRELNRHFVCTTATSDANVWSGRYAGAGGIITSYLSSGTYYRVHTFLNSGTFYMENATSVDYLIVAGGGGGGGSGAANSGAAGGGAGGFRTATGLSIAGGTYDVTVGAGGLGGNAVNDNFTATKGEDSIFSTITSNGGGAAPNSNNQSTRPGNMDGGSGAGGTSNTVSATGYAGHALLVTSPVQGYIGGTSLYTGNYPAGGGGGASAAGAAPINNATAANGGAGAANAYRTGSNITYAGGGGGGFYGSTSYSSGGSGGGGAGGGNGAQAGGNGGTNLGGGGGGTAGRGSGGAAQVGGNGGSGIVVIRYAL